MLNTYLGLFLFFETMKLFVGVGIGVYMGWNFFFLKKNRNTVLYKNHLTNTIVFIPFALIIVFISKSAFAPLFKSYILFFVVMVLTYLFMLKRDQMISEIS